MQMYADMAEKIDSLNSCMCSASKELEVSGDLVDLALWRGSNAQNSRRATGNLRTACVVDDLRAQAETDSLRLQHEHVFLAINLEGDLGLTESLPALQHWVRRVCAHERLVTRQSGV